MIHARFRFAGHQQRVVWFRLVTVISLPLPSVFHIAGCSTIKATRSLRVGLLVARRCSMPVKNDNLGPAAKEQYDAGIKLLKAKKLDEALACFDRARCIQKHSFLIEDARVKALSELRIEGWFPRAFEAARALVTRFGTSSPRVGLFKPALASKSPAFYCARLTSVGSISLLGSTGCR